MNRITSIFQSKDKEVLNVYFTAGYPALDDTLPVLRQLEASGVDLIEIGIPFSDPIADGPTIQMSNHQALGNGMNLPKLISQLEGMRAEVSVPVILMGYLNPIMQYGIEKFCASMERIGVDGLIIPDLPMDEYIEFYEPIFKKHGLFNIFLITPQTSQERIRKIDAISQGFIYMVSSASITGAKTGISEAQVAYFERINQMNLENPRLIGFGISDRESFQIASQYAHGAIIGSAFINVLSKAKDLATDIPNFIQQIKGK